MRVNRIRIYIFTLFLLVAASSAQAGVVRFAAASSLKECLNEISANFSRKHHGVTFLKNYGASGSLAQQLQNGAPADLFISASVDWVTYLKERNLLAGASITEFACNTLVAVGRPGTAAASLPDLLRLQRIAIGSPRSVPAGEYAMEALKRAGVSGPLGKKLVLGKDARECLMYAERGEVDAALVYRTDALLARRARILFNVPHELHRRVSYPMALTQQGAANAEARAFFDYLQGAEAKAVLTRYGFLARQP